MLRQILLGKITPNPDQPRKLFAREALAELAASIRENGLMQPITVRPKGDGTYEIVAGERRWRAHCLLAETGQLPGGTILVQIKAMDDESRDVQAIIENLSRTDITPLEEARAFRRMLDRGMSQEELARRLGMNQPWRIAEKVRLLNLAPPILKLYEAGQLGGEAAYEIARLADERDQTRIVQMIARGQLTGYKAVKAAVAAVLDRLSQDDIFGSAPKATEAEVRIVDRMEAKVDQVAAVVAAGWREGECIVARKVSPDRARLMADKIKAMRTHLLQMENALREAAAQADLLAA